jgi:hypothetical protein
MGLENCLSSIQALGDLPRLVAALGHESLWETGPAEAWAHSSSHSQIRLIGRTGALPWFASES